jgi:hypothetical protein
VEAIRRVQASMGISDEEHAALAAEITNDKDRLLERQRRLVYSLCGLESARFSLSCDRRPESLLIRHDLLQQQKLLIREAVGLTGSIGDPHAAGALAATIRAVAGSAAQGALDEAIEAAPAPMREVLRQPMPPGAVRSYFDVIEASGPADVVLRGLARGTDPGLAALAVSALADTDPAGSRALADELRARAGTLSFLAEEALASVARGRPSGTVEVMAKLLSASIFSTLDVATLGEIAQRSSLVTFASGASICRAGESSDAMFVLVQGATLAWAEGPSGRVELRRGGEGAVFGELGVITGRPRSATIEVTSPAATVVAIPRAAVDDLLGRNLGAAQGILKVVSGYLLDGTPAATPHRPQTADEPVPTA